MEHPVCQTEGHDMRPMPSIQARVCRRCAYFAPIQEDEEECRSPWVIVYLAASIVLTILAGAFALYMNI